MFSNSEGNIIVDAFDFKKFNKNVNIKSIIDSQLFAIFEYHIRNKMPVQVISILPGWYLSGKEEKEAYNYLKEKGFEVDKQFVHSKYGKRQQFVCSIP